MKRIVILCDGTWGHVAARYPTNVVLLARALMPVDSDDVMQVPVYVPGVGSGRRGVTPVGRVADRLLGGAMGLGLMENVAEAYLHLVFLYEPGDEIFIFGFSRGAFTARSLTGLIRSTGILDRMQLARLPEVLARYRSRDPDTHPDSDASRRFRMAVSPHLMTSEADRDAYEENARDLRLTPPLLLRLAYLGVWDTVGALGVPNRFLGLSKLWNRRYAFHDAKLSGLVRAARHAVALDERRREFEPTLWTNIDALNAAGASDDPLYRQRYFAGDHSSVGGGGKIRCLSSIALDWIMDGAAVQGLAFDPAIAAEIAADRNPFGALTSTSLVERGLVAALVERFGRDRRGPKHLIDLHPAVLERWAFETDAGGWPPYRPGSLRALQSELSAWRKARLSEPNSETRIT